MIVQRPACVILNLLQDLTADVAKGRFRIKFGMTPIFRVYCLVSELVLQRRGVGLRPISTRIHWNPLGVLLLLLLMIAQAPSVAAQGSYYDPRPVATYGDLTVSVTDFATSYFAYWQATHEPDSPRLRQTVARQMIEHMLVARSARATPYAAAPGLARQVRRDHERFARRRYLEDEVQAHVPLVTEADIEAAMQQAERRYFVRQLFALTEPEIQALYERVQAGEDFAALARATMPDAEVAAAGGALGWIGWGDTDLPVEAVLFGLDAGDVSAPVESLMGWHVFRVDSVETTMRFDTPHPLERQRTADALTSRRFDYAAALHIREIVWAHDLAVDMQVAREVWRMLAPMLPRQRGIPIRPALESASDAAPEVLAQTPMAMVDGQPFTVGQFLYQLPDIPASYLGPNLKQALEIAIRDSIMTGRALAQGYGDDPVVATRTARARTSYLFNAIAEAAAMAAETDPVDPRAFYAQQRTRYVDHVKTEVWEILVASPDTARALARQVAEGASVEALARQHTLRDSVRARGGYLGFVRSDAGPIGARAGQLKAPAGLFAPVETAAGYSVIVTGEREVVYAPFEQVRARVEQDAQHYANMLIYSTLLPDDYDPADVQLDTALLASAIGGLPAVNP